MNQFKIDLHELQLADDFLPTSTPLIKILEDILAKKHNSPNPPTSYPSKITGSYNLFVLFPAHK